jgi:hypothetical protein
MKLYKLSRYRWIDEEFCFEHGSKDVVEQEALKRSADDKGYYTYRMETWLDDIMIGEWRFFHNGVEFTKDIMNACLDGILGK